MKEKLNSLLKWSLYAISVILIACDSYLDKKPNFGLETPNTLESLQKLLDATDEMNLNVPSYGEVSADDYFLQQTTYEGLSEGAKRMYHWENYIYYYNNDWAKGYIPVYQANLVLSLVDKVDGSVQEKNRIKGAALFYRSFQFLNLVETYSKGYDSQSADIDPGIALRVTADHTAPSVRISVSDAYTRVLEDLKIAATLLPELPSHPMRPSVWAAEALLARAYLNMGNYDSAYVHADRSLSKKNTLLNFNKITDVDIGASFPFKQFNEETVFYAQLTSSQPNVHPSYALIDTSLYDSYEKGDLRKKAYFKERGKYVFFKGSYGASNSLFGGIAMDEVYLIRAEANVRLGRMGEGLKDLNDLLQSRWEDGKFVPLSSNSREEALNLILLERRKELLMRGLRWIDIKRLNRDFANIVIKRHINGSIITLEPGDRRYALPLPSDVLQASGMKQNEY